MCSTRFDKVSGIEPRSKQRSWLSGISSSYCNDRTADANRACALLTGFCAFGSHNSGVAIGLDDRQTGNGDRLASDEDFGCTGAGRVAIHKAALPCRERSLTSFEG